MIVMRHKTLASKSYAIQSENYIIVFMSCKEERMLCIALMYHLELSLTLHDSANSLSPLCINSRVLLCSLFFIAHYNMVSEVV